MIDIELVNQLSRISIEISSEKDVDKLLKLILESCVDLIGCDAGSIYTIENEKLLFKYTVNKSLNIPYESFTMDINKKSIAGSAVINKQSYIINDMNNLEDILGIKHNDSFDKIYGYKTMNMLVIPLENLTSEIIGVMQLINKKENKDDVISSDFKGSVVPYNNFDEQITKSLASQSAILIERTRLHQELDNLLESMISTLSTTLDQRDPVTAGHSERVSNYTLALAKEINRNDTSLRSISFDENQLKELRIASMLHDIGKIGVAEAVLQKKDKVTPADMNEIALKIRIYDDVINQDYLKGNSDHIIHRIRKINSGTFLTDDDLELLDYLYKIDPFQFRGETYRILTEDQYKNLSVRRGNLTQKERTEINNHAKYTNQILKKIEWGKSLTNVPSIASKHHEKLNGKGYPNHLEGMELSIIERLLPIVDIFDALTANDRPYKPAMSVEKAVKILYQEVDSGALDKELVDVFVNNVVGEG